ncbi:MAG: bifunctional (p)ppGpp synthetase/guanosine-3',5'-bis(diphosphate) 3'-pyrophosphohydrolase [Bdellovibrionota bacterium]
MAEKTAIAAIQNEDKGLKPIKVLNDLLERITSYYPNADLEFIKKAYEMSEKAHEGQIRRSGEAYISHPLSVAGILTELKLDLNTVATGLLHDTVEDTTLTLKDIETHFGKNVAALVDGVTKISQMNYKNTHAKQAENVRKMMVAMGKDVRVVIVKLADRLHNMRTLSHMPYAKQARIAEETLDIYAPLAHRLGISNWKIELEDLALRYLKPDIYYSLAQKVAMKKTERERYIADVKKILDTEMKKEGIALEVQGRPKHLYSIYKKMQERNIEFEQIHDVLAFRIIVGSVAQCYEALGVVHSKYRPVPGRFKDFIAMAKTNNYQSLHTTVIGPEAERIEIQIRTKEMHDVAERGIAAHWNYKLGGTVDKTTIDKFNWIQDVLSEQSGVGDSSEFLENVKTDLFDSEIYVFTPKGDVHELPEGATPLDFAYAIHTNVGARTVGAKIDGRMVPLKHVLKNGDTVEILTSTTQKPSKDWLKMCITSRAQSKIRSFIRTEERKRATEIGQELLEKEMRGRQLSPDKYFKGQNLEKIKEKMKVVELEELFMQIGYGKVLAHEVGDLFAEKVAKSAEAEQETFLQKVFKSAAKKRKKSDSLIIVDGMSDLLVRYGKCCQPIPGDPIIGFISRGRGVTVHQASCQKVFSMDNDRQIDVSWNNQSEAGGMTKIRIVCQDAPGLLQKLSDPFATSGVNIYNAKIRTNKDQKAICIFDVKVKDTNQLLTVIQNLQKIKGVIKVDRVSGI